MSFTPASEFTTRPTLTGSFGMSASTHWLATATAQSVLEQGGNAFDAVVAGAFVLHVVEPHLNGPGGDVVGIFATAGGEPTVLMGQGPAPSGASAETYRELGLQLVPGAGALAAAIPGAVDAWLLLLRDHGTWELSRVLQFAVQYARNGHPVLDRVTATIERMREHFERYWPTSAALWVNYRNTMPELADTFERLAASSGASRVDRIDAARRQWSSGFVAAAIDEFVRVPHRHSDGNDYAGVITARDLSDFSASFEQPVTLDFRGHTVAKSGAWGQGPALLQMLALLDGCSTIDPSTPLGAHTILEVEKLALADRDAWFGDVGDIPLDVLLSRRYIYSRRALVGERASHELRPGSVHGRSPFRPPLTVGTAGLGEPTISGQGVTRGDTCHIDVIDRWGNIISATPSGGWLQSSPAIPGLGFCLGSRLQMTWLQDGSPATLTPGRRPRTTLTPTLVLRDGRAVTALGSPGGDQQDTWQLLYLLRTIVGGYTPQQAIDAPAFHTTSFPDSFWPRQWEPGGVVVEDRLGAEVIDSLEARGHLVSRAGDWALGRLSAVGIDDRGFLWAAANPRGNQGYAAGR